jgi:hypothetical protein
MGRLLAGLLLMGVLLLGPCGAWAGPVEWREVAANADGRQWWDAGSLRISKAGNLSVLSRFQPATPESLDGAQRPPASSLYVMEIDCGQELFRDTSVNGIPQWGSGWQPAGRDDLIERTIQAVCMAGADLLAGS